MGLLSLDAHIRDVDICKQIASIATSVVSGSKALCFRRFHARKIIWTKDADLCTARLETRPIFGIGTQICLSAG